MINPFIPLTGHSPRNNMSLKKYKAKCQYCKAEVERTHRRLINTCFTCKKLNSRFKRINK